MTETPPPPNNDPESLKARLAKAQETRRAGETLKEETAQRYESLSGAGLAMRLSTEMLGALLVSLFLGYWMDVWFKTSPYLLLLMLCFGLAAGFMGAIRAYRNFNTELEAQAAAENDGQTNGTDTI